MLFEQGHSINGIHVLQFECSATVTHCLMLSDPPGVHIRTGLFPGLVDQF